MNTIPETSKAPENIQEIYGLSIVVADSLLTVTEDVREKVNYICLRDPEGHQTWHTTDEPCVVWKIVNNDHAEKLSKIDALIQGEYTLKSQPEQSQTSNVFPFRGPKKILMTADEVPQLFHQMQKGDLLAQKMREAKDLDTAHGKVLAGGGIRGKFRRI